MPKKIPGVWGLAPTSKENCSRSESTTYTNFDKQVSQTG